MKQIVIPKERRFLGIWIPVGVYCAPISLTKKILCLDVKSMAEYYKSNAAIGRFLGLSPRQAQRLVLELIEEGMLSAKYVDVTSETGLESRRYLSVTPAFDLIYHSEGDDIDDVAPAPNSGQPPRQKRSTPHDERVLQELPLSENNEVHDSASSVPLELEMEVDENRDREAVLSWYRIEYKRVMKREPHMNGKQKKEATRLAKEHQIEDLTKWISTLADQKLPENPDRKYYTLDLLKLEKQIPRLDAILAENPSNRTVGPGTDWWEERFGKKDVPIK